ncbi:MAG: HlyD family secretion protein [Parachlamydiaceae bacterium]|nr:HlyD family secretion protein [Parachlamydiaceae bacterium]
MSDSKEENKINQNHIEPLPNVTTNGNGASPAIPSNTKSHALWWFTAFLVLAGIGWFCYWYFYLQYYESTDDAYANGNLIAINSSISGPIIAYYADNTDLVKEGQLLALIDKTEYQIIYEKEFATLASIVLEVRQLFDSVNANRANVENKTASLENARFDFENRQKLIDSQAVSNQDFIHSKNEYEIAQLTLKQAEYQLDVTIAAAGNGPIELHPLIEKQKSNIRSAYYNLQHCSIYAPATGYVAQRTVDVGEWVAPQKDLMAIIPTEYVWVDANYKETQLTYMRVGQPAVVWFDIYGSKVKYEGKVIGIASGTGSVFSLIPAQNATGNWIKIVQRLPVRISLDPEVLKNYPVRIGLSAQVSVDLTNQDLPMLTQTTSTKTVATTKVFDIHMEEVDKKIDEIIQQNLKPNP